MLMAALLAQTERVRVFPDVANLPLRPPAMLAKAAASLDVLSGGRFELGLGAGAFWEGIEAMGGPRRSAGESVDALAEAIEIVRLFWSGQHAITYEGRYYTVKGLHPGPAPAHRIEIWLGAYRPRMLALTGRAADGWIPSLGYAAPETIPERQARIDEAAAAAGRRPEEIRRAYNLPPTEAEEIVRFALELGFDTFIVWPGDDGVRDVERFGGEIAPTVREAVAAERG
jgi:alkanesulfonate monooxygenase SsuD/methylene tetrahydromethanopterin reductase-like flavin-dependent oxidoreductase (luciferase family)